ncbi:MAG: HD domain-containing protein, partial [Candidatus Margulisiibacteriota bacterium]
IMTAEKPSIGVEYMKKSGLLKIVIPELEEGIGVKQPKPFHIEDVYRHNLSTCDCAPKELPMVRLAALFHDIAKPGCKKEDTFYNHDYVGEQTAENIMKRLKFSNEEIKAVKNLIKNHMFNYTKEWGDSAVRRFINRVGVDNLEDLFLLRNADLEAMKRQQHNEHVGELKARINKILAENDALSVSQLKVNGKDVMAILNTPPGPKVGEVLDFLLEKVLDDPSLNSRKKLTELMGGFWQT